VWRGIIIVDSWRRRRWGRRIIYRRRQCTPNHGAEQKAPDCSSGIAPTVATMVMVMIGMVPAAIITAGAGIARIGKGQNSYNQHNCCNRNNLFHE
jgi:hypothetical protein